MDEDINIIGEEWIIAWLGVPAKVIKKFKEN